MAEWHKKGKRKPSGGHRNTLRRRDKRLAEKGGTPTHTKIGADKRTVVEGRGNTKKVKALQARQAVVIDPKTKKPVKATIIAVQENKANRQFTRQNIITKGAKIRVKIGDKEASAIVTSRPGKNGTVQAVLQ